MEKDVALTRSRALRARPTDAEQTLWRHLRNRQIEETKFRRQEVVESYIVDFVSYSKKLVVELDGSQHLAARRYDTVRNLCLEASGFTVLRFWNHEIFCNLEGVLETIRRHCIKHRPPHPDPLPPGERE